MKIIKNKISTECSIQCDHRIIHNDHKKIGKITRRKCKKDAPQFYYFNGKDTINLCAEHAKEYETLHLTVKER